MTLVTRLGNMLERHSSVEVVKEYVEFLGEEYPVFVNGELKVSNDRNNRKLCGQESKVSLDEDEENDKEFEMNMDQLMQKFTSFDSLFKKADNNDDEEQEDQVEEKLEDGEEQEEKQNQHEGQPSLKVLETNVAEPVPLQQEYTDQGYWKVNYQGENSIDDLLADYE